jgi:hypothetical protein
VADPSSPLETIILIDFHVLYHVERISQSTVPAFNTITYVTITYVQIFATEAATPPC